MAILTRDPAPALRIRAWLRAACDRALALMVRHFERHPRMRRIEALKALDDEDLAAQGIRRADIVRHVCGARFFT